MNRVIKTAVMISLISVLGACASTELSPCASSFTPSVAANDPCGPKIDINNLYSYGL